MVLHRLPWPPALLDVRGIYTLSLRLPLTCLALMTTAPFRNVGTSFASPSSFPPREARQPRRDEAVLSCATSSFLHSWGWRRQIEIDIDLVAVPWMLIETEASGGDGKEPDILLLVKVVLLQGLCSCSWGDGSVLRYRCAILYFCLPRNVFDSNSGWKRSGRRS